MKKQRRNEYRRVCACLSGGRLGPSGAPRQSYSPRLVGGDRLASRPSGFRRSSFCAQSRRRPLPPCSVPANANHPPPLRLCAVIVPVVLPYPRRVASAGRRHNVPRPLTSRIVAAWHERAQHRAERAESEEQESVGAAPPGSPRHQHRYRHTPGPTTTGSQARIRSRARPNTSPHPIHGHTYTRHPIPYGRRRSSSLHDQVTPSPYESKPL